MWASWRAGRPWPGASARPSCPGSCHGGLGAARAGDSVLFYTDGVTEAHVAGEEEFGIGQLADLAGRHGQISSSRRRSSVTLCVPCSITSLINSTTTPPWCSCAGTVRTTPTSNSLCCWLLALAWRFRPRTRRPCHRPRRHRGRPFCEGMDKTDAVAPDGGHWDGRGAIRESRPERVGCSLAVTNCNAKRRAYVDRTVKSLAA